MNQNFANYVELARGESRFWKVILTLVFWFVGYFVMAGIFITLASNQLVFSGLATGRFVTPIAVYVLLLTFVIWVAAFWGALRLFHKRGIGSVLGGPKSKVIRNFAIAVGVSAVFLLSVQYIFPSDDHIQQNLSASRWLALMPIGLALMLIQVSAEELIFRGYLQQQFAIWIENRWFYMLFPSLIFGLMHFDGSMGMGVGLMVVCATGLLGLFLADLTYRTGNLGAAIGVHFANNFSAMFWVSYQEQISGLARYVAPEYFDQPELFIQAAKSMLITTAILFFVYFVIMEWRERR
jgi:membrane protease YdiL (CAAX protease family)